MINLHIYCAFILRYIYLKTNGYFFKIVIIGLKPGGYLVLHLVDKDKFDPIIPVADVFNGLDPQKFF